MQPVEVKGILRAVHLDQDWMEIQDGHQQFRINDVGETLDDVIGPMMNRQVTVKAAKDQNNKLHFRDIEAEE